MSKLAEKVLEEVLKKTAVAITVAIVAAVSKKVYDKYFDEEKPHDVRAKKAKAELYENLAEHSKDPNFTINTTKII